MADSPATLTEAQVSKLKAFNTKVQNLINLGAVTRIWTGSRELINPSTGEVTGTQETRNVDLVVPDKKLFEGADAWIKALKGTGHYLKNMFAGKYELVAIASRYDTVRDRLVVQYAEPNTGQTFDSTSDEFAGAMEDTFGTPAVKSDAKPVGNTSKETADKVVNTDADDLPY